MTESNGSTHSNDGMLTIIPRTPASEAALDAVVKITRAYTLTVEEATTLATAIKDFTEQAIRDERTRIRMLLEDSSENGWIESPLREIIMKLGIDGS